MQPGKYSKNVVTIAIVPVKISNMTNRVQVDVSKVVAARPVKV